MTVLITGCSTGIGRATAELLAAGGHTVYATARKLEAIADLEAKGCKTLALDVTDEESMKTAVGDVVDAEGHIGALVNNAGYSQSGALETVDLDTLRRQFETNVFGLVRMCQLVLPSMRAAGSGRIVNIGSMGGKVVFPGGGAYHATKFSVEAISDALRWEVKPFGVGVVLIEPGAIRTEFAAAVNSGLDSLEADDGPYARFNKSVGEVTTAAYEGPMKAFSAGPEAVAKVVQRAITSRRPRPRYTVTLGAKALIGTHAVLTDRGWDAFVSTQFRERPGG
jgi:NAD(P)-dependent dehydrogenase (short-subunit alcohol dehydrogenase family)